MTDTSGPLEAMSPAALEPGSDELRELFPGSNTQTYLDTASYGLPPRGTVDVLEDALQAWSAGAAYWPDDWDVAGEACRTLVAPMLGAQPEEVALLPAVSVGAGLVAASIKPGSRVLIPEDEFRSLLFPFLAAQRAFGVQVRRVPFDQLAGAVDEGTDLVVTSHVRSQDGRVQDLARLSTATQRVGARLLVDATHSAGILQPPGSESGVDYLVAAAYKHLLCPRGVAFLRASRSGCEELHPFTSSWRSARSPYLDYFGGELSDLADGAARFDVSLAWHPWLGARESLSLLAGVPTEKRERWSVGLASRLARALSLPATGSSFLSVPVVGSRATLAAKLKEANVKAAVQQGGIRLSFHVYNTPADVEAAANALAPLRASST